MVSRVRLLNPKTHESRLYWANSRDGLVVVPQIGQFKADDGGKNWEVSWVSDQTRVN